MSREDYVPTQHLRVQAWQAAEQYEETGDVLHLATERALRNEITRRYRAGECETCGYVESDCLCVGCVDGHDIVLVNELERGAIS